MRTSGSVQFRHARSSSGPKGRVWPFALVRYGILKIFYKIIALLLSVDADLHDAVLSSLKAKSQARILIVGKNVGLLARSIALHCPEALIAVYSPWPRFFITLLLRLLRNHPTNLVVLRACPGRTGDVREAAFDHVVSAFAFDTRTPEEKAHLSKDILCSLVDGGWLHIVDYDAPLQSKEMALLSMLSYLYGSEAVGGHVDGKWIDCLNSVGFSQIRRQQSVSISGARIAVVTARKRKWQSGNSSAGRVAKQHIRVFNNRRLVDGCKKRS